MTTPCTFEARVAERLADFQRGRGGEDPPGEEEARYLLEVASFVWDYYTTKDPAPSSRRAGPLDDLIRVTHREDKNTVMRRYLFEVEGEDENWNEWAMAEPCGSDMVCECGGAMLHDTRESSLVCPECGTAKAFFEGGARNLSYEDEVNLNRVSSFAYKRLNHFCEWLNSLQAKVRPRALGARDPPA